jgi:D-alanyl-D-alanine carboxypeptidase
MEKIDRRDAAASAGKRTGRRACRRRRRISGPGRVLFSVSAGLFVMALVLTALTPPPAQAGSEAGRGLPDSAGVTAPPPSRGEEPVPPSEEEENWRLVLVNAWNPLPEDGTVTLKELSNGLQVDERCYPDLQAMMDACRADGGSPVICSAYRSREKQAELFQGKVDRLLAQGYTREGAEAEAGKSVAVPGTSEHQLGLAVDIVDLYNQNLDHTQEDTAVQKWLMEHSWEYGFVLRYPNGKSELTGIIYEPWHYRYVGREAAAEMRTLEVCLEEYLDLLHDGSGTSTNF